MAQDEIIHVENLSKAYRIGVAERAHDTFVGQVGAWIKTPLRNLRRLKRLDAYGAREEEEDVVWALREVSFGVQRGEVLGIIGHNGAGKSTLLKLLSRITDPTEGRAEIRGRVSSLLEVGTGFHPELTGRENIYLNGTVLGMRKREIDAKFDEMVEFSGVAKFIDTPIKRYSSGMTVRLAFAVAAHLEPEILIIDEVLAVGDAEFQRKCLGKMKDVAGHGRTVLFVSHNIQSISSLTQRCLVMEGGRLARDAGTAEAVNYYLGTRGRASRLGGPKAVEELNVEHRAVADPRVRFKKIGLADGFNSTIAVGGEVALEVVVEAQMPLKDLRFGYTLRHLTEGAVLSGFTGGVGVSVGEQRLRVRIGDLWLAPGEYEFCMGISSGRDAFPARYYDMLIGFGYLHVEQALVDGEPIPLWNAAWGGVLHNGGVLERI